MDKLQKEREREGERCQKVTSDREKKTKTKGGDRKCQAVKCV